MKRSVAALVFVSFASACGRGGPPMVTAGDAARAHVELAELQHGRELFVRKCGGSCHRVPEPADYTPAEWPGKLDEMSARAGLKVEQRRLIEKYVITMAEQR